MKKISPRIIACGLLILVSLVYLSFQIESVYGGDAGDLLSAIVNRGIAHPPGYPLYTLAGVLLSQIIPFGTLAYKVGFLSTIPAVLCLFFLFDLLTLLTKKVIPSLLAVLVLAFLYPFWLYSESVEVFSLNNFFLVILLWLTFRFYYSSKKEYLLLAALFFGLSLSHHHIILFLLPALVSLLWQKKKKLSAKLKISLFALVFAGLLPYAYILIAAYFRPVFNWMGTLTFANFWTLVTRVGYGTFRSGSGATNLFILRFLDLWAYFDLSLKDFRLLGFLLGITGLIYLFKKNRPVFYPLFLGFASYLFFIFYAAFPLTENFSLATFERFVQPIYLFWIFFLVFGLLAVEIIVEKIMIAVGLAKEKSRLVGQLAMFIFFIYPLCLFFLNYPKITILKKDFTAENFARDILNSLPEGGILIIATDTPLFDTQYVYYTERKWPKVKLVHLSRVFQADYLDDLKQAYPDLALPAKNLSAAETIKQLVNLNYSRIPIYTKLVFRFEDSATWVPWGLVFRYYQEKDLSNKKEIFTENERLWQKIYHDPFAGSLATYQNLMLSDVLRNYAVARQETGLWETKNGYHKEAEAHLLAAQKLNPEDTDAYIILAQIFVTQKQCVKAQEQLEILKQKDPQDATYYLLSSVNASECFLDKEKAAEFERMYKEKKKTGEKKLENF